MDTATTVPTTLLEMTGTWKLDPTHTTIGFVARHAMVTKVRGSFNEFTGTGTVNAEDLAATRVDVTIQTDSIDTRNSQRDDHLRSGEFLGASEYPTITFTSTHVTVTSPTTFDLTGDLTIKGTTKPVTIPFTFTGAAVDPFDNVRAGFEGSTAISRKDYGITWNAALETGGVLVSDTINLEFDVAAIATN